MKRVIKLWFAAAVLILLLAANVSAESYKAGGECGKDLKWSLDYNGNLYIYGEGPMKDGGFNSNDWRAYGSEIQTVTVEKGATTIGKYAFYDCPNITTVKLPDTIRIIDSYAFQDCGKLSKINLPNGLKELGSGTFENCSSLTSIKLPPTLENLGDRGWGLQTFKKSGLTSITIPSSVKKMASYCFEECPNLKTATINGTNLELEFQSFIYCPKLTTVKMGSGVTSIEAWAFAGCTNLSNVTLGRNLTRIEHAAFKGCTSLKELVIPDKVTLLNSRSYDTFCGECTSLEKIVIGVGVKTIKDFAFRDCPSLKVVEFCGSAPVFEGNSTFQGCGNITAYYPAGDKTWDRSNLTAHGAGRIDWQTWTVPLNHFSTSIKSVTNISKAIEVKWNKMKNVTGYLIERKVGNGKYEKVKTITSGNTLSWKDTSVKNGQRYTYRVYGTNGTNISKVSPAKYRYYVAPNTLTSLSKSGKTFTAKWKSNSSATGYQIQYAKNSKFTGAKTVKVGSRKILSKKVSPNFRGKCYVRVRTYKTVNKTNYYSAWSNVKSTYF